jgi:PAS domain-containing protein
VVSINYEGRRASLGNFMDITERKRAEEGIRRAAEEWTTTFDSITDLVSIVDTDFRIIRANKAFADTFKKTPAEIVGKTCYQFCMAPPVHFPGAPT